ncbi:MAG TPA: isocitrate/isopropylmalate dehydrogenase family protein [Deinococcales bacterium]|nr:isocitrate/isopropylmalate dehydrogenase family protein [Deinococcales bacterium]
MAKHTICIIEGDGIGHEVIPAARTVLEGIASTGHLEFQWIEAEAGWELFERTGNSIPDETLERVRSAAATLFGAATSPSRKVQGFRGAIRHMRRALDLYANVRPAKHHPVPGSREGVDLIVVRENTEGLYVEQERREGDTAIAEAVITKRASERIGHYAARLAAQRPRKQLAIAHKANVLPVTQGLFLETARAAAAEVEGVEVSDIIIDAAAMKLVRNPESFDVMVTTNLFGDIISDLTAGLVGGLGIAASGNIGDQHAVFESVHGSAPDIAGRGIANPTATVLAAAMMLRHLGESAAADRLERAVDIALEQGPRTPDLGGTASTSEFAQVVLDAYRSA